MASKRQLDLIISASDRLHEALDLSLVGSENALPGEIDPAVDLIDELKDLVIGETKQ